MASTNQNYFVQCSSLVFSFFPPVFLRPFGEVVRRRPLFLSTSPVFALLLLHVSVPTHKTAPTLLSSSNVALCTAPCLNLQAPTKPPRLAGNTSLCQGNTLQPEPDVNAKQTERLLPRLVFVSPHCCCCCSIIHFSFA